jgi:hypothetical protein
MLIRNELYKAAQKWDAIPLCAHYAFMTAYHRANNQRDTRWARRALAMHMGAAAARGDNVGAANIKAMIIACS